MVRRAFTLSLCAALIVSGLPQGAAAHVVAARVQTGRFVRPVVPGAAFRTLPNLAQPKGFGLTSTLRSSLSPVLTPSLLTGIAPTADSALGLSGAVGRRLSPVARVETVAAGIALALEATGSVATASRASAFGLGHDVQSLLSGERVRRLSDAVTAPAQSESLGLEKSSPGYFFAKPAGEDIARSLRDNRDLIPPTKDDGAPQGPRPGGDPFWAKLLASGIALLPGVFLGWPLLVGTGLSGAFVIAASAALAVMPFFSERWPKLVRGIPGWALLALGTVTTMVGLVNAPALPAGLLALLGGWGLTRFGRAGDAEDRRLESKEVLAAFFGAVAAITSAGLILLGPGGWLAAALPWLSYPVSALLWFSLPAWLGEGLARAFLTVGDGWTRVARVLRSIRRETVLRDRLDAFHDRLVAKSGWYAVLLYLTVWPAVWLLNDLPHFLLIAVLSVALAAVELPVMFLWGAMGKLWPKSGATVFFGEWARMMYDHLQGSKARVYNPLARALVPYANSKRLVLSLPAALGLRLLQYGWAAYTVLAAPVLLVGRLGAALSRIGRPYDAERHDPASLESGSKAKDAIGVPKPPLDDDAPAPETGALAPKVIAAVMALSPLLLLSYPVAGSLAALDVSLFALISLVTAAMPLMRGKAAKWVRRTPGIVMTVIGVGIALTGQGFWLGLLAAVSGWGLMRYSGRDESEDDRRSADGKYIGTYIGSIGVTTGMGVALLGLSGTLPVVLSVLAFLTSPLLLQHLPEWLFEGFANLFRGFAVAAKGAHAVAGSWRKETKFLENRDRQWEYWISDPHNPRRSVFHSAWLWPLVWFPLRLAQLVALAASGAVALLYGAYLAPLNLAWGVAHRARPKSAVTRFLSGMVRFLHAWSDGSKKRVFDPLNEPFVEPMSRSVEPSGKPTLAARAAYWTSRLVQAVWLAWVLLAASPALAAALWAFGAPGLLVGVALFSPMGWGLLALAVGAGFKAMKDQPDPERDDPENQR